MEATPVTRTAVVVASPVTVREIQATAEMHRTGRHHHKEEDIVEEWNIIRMSLTLVEESTR